MKIEQIQKQFSNVFVNDLDRLSTITTLEHSINTGTEKPITKTPFRFNPKIKELVCAEVKKLLDAKIIRSSKSPWRSNVVPQYKKNGDFRLCIDYRWLNALTKFDAYN
jgi:hypothetical protein